MADLKRVYWDSCIWLSLINQENADRVQRCQYVLDMARRKEVEVWTSALTLAEVFKKKCEGENVALPASKDSEFEQYIQQEHLFLVQLDYDIGKEARRLLRAFPKLKKPPDGIHLATAALNNIDEVHTFDGENLLPLDGLVTRADGVPLVICEPPAPVQGSLQLQPPDGPEQASAAITSPPDGSLDQATAENQPELPQATDSVESAPVEAQIATKEITPEGAALGGSGIARSGEGEGGHHQSPPQSV